MKALTLLLVVIVGSVFGDAYGVLASQYYTVRRGGKVCAIDVVTLTNGKVMTEKSCFKI